MIHPRHRPIAMLLAAAAVLFAGPAAAHARLVSSVPAADATTPAPKTITLTFSEKVIPAFSGFELAASGRKAAVTTSVSKDGKSLVGVVSGALKPGPHVVTWHAASGDGHRMSGTVAFQVK